MKAKRGAVEVVPNRLYWLSDKGPPRGISNAFYFCVDDELTYTSFFADFGPLSVAKIYRYIVGLDRLFSATPALNSVVYHYTGLRPESRLNAAFIVGCYLVARGNLGAEEASARFDDVKPPLCAFRDASNSPSSYQCTLRHCLRGFEHGLRAGLLTIDKFDLCDYEFLEKANNGDLNWIVPGKLLAFSSPSDRKSPRGTPSAAELTPLLKRLGVTLVVRLCKPAYNRDDFCAAGIEHVELGFPDGTTPSAAIINSFLDAVESAPGAVAVHCKAGLGRTGTLIAIYLMKHYHFCGADVIGFLRIIRPGSVLGCQQQFLVHNQRLFWKLPSPAFISSPAELRELAQRMRESDNGCTECGAPPLEVADPAFTHRPEAARPRALKAIFY